MKGHPQSGDTDHRQIIGAVTNGNGLLQVDVFHPGNGFEYFRLFGTVNNVALYFPGDPAV